jgi:hypothetical protein
MITATLVGSCSIATPLSAHGGGLDRSGCHNNRRTGDYHCHRGGEAPPVLFRSNPPVADRPRERLPRVQPSYLTRQIQLGLIALDYDIPAADNIMGPSTEAAINRFLGEQNLPQDGKATPELLDLIIEKVDAMQAEKLAKR